MKYINNIKVCLSKNGIPYYVGLQFINIEYGPTCVMTITKIEEDKIYLTEVYRNFDEYAVIRPFETMSMLDIEPV